MKYIKKYEKNDSRLRYLGYFLMDFMNELTGTRFNIDESSDEITIFLYEEKIRVRYFFLKNYDFFGFNHFFFEKNEFIYNNQYYEPISFIETQINKYKDYRGLVNINEISNIKNDITRENYEIFKNIKKYNI